MTRRCVGNSSRAPPLHLSLTLKNVRRVTSSALVPRWKGSKIALCSGRSAAVGASNYKIFSIPTTAPQITWPLFNTTFCHFLVSVTTPRKDRITKRWDYWPLSLLLPQSMPSQMVRIFCHCNWQIMNIIYIGYNLGCLKQIISCQFYDENIFEISKTP